ncbi:hypothetical protein [Lederbergia lenta]|uniref:Uncharacterized protein n=1 Tax=Lederbergia lenta TaxID=1467 RepID=A0A2X4VKG4_LEDLE|nr:hypothetical protein [Lederbergia lenta]MEC2323514.1 hypothetical protein [Lederbergia lenta]SQI52666.1 Uncharacterised protein [Lederbergia lenta]
MFQKANEASIGYKAVLLIFCILVVIKLFFRLNQNMAYMGYVDIALAINFIIFAYLGIRSIIGKRNKRY